LKIFRGRKSCEAERDRGKKTKGRNSFKDFGKVDALIGKDTEFNGQMRFQGAVRIDGRLTGDVESEEGILIIGETAKIEAEIRTNTVLISGEVKGNIQATGRIEIHSTGMLFGDLKTPVLVINEGATFEGQSQMVGIKHGDEENGEHIIGKPKVSRPVDLKIKAEVN